MIEREQLALPGAPNEVWSIDFVMDALSNRRRVKCLTVVDDFTKEAIDIVVDHGISGLYTARALVHDARARSGCHRSMASGLQRAKAAQRTELPCAVRVCGETSGNRGCSCRFPGVGLKGLCWKLIGLIEGGRSTGAATSGGGSSVTTANDYRSSASGISVRVHKHATCIGCGGARSKRSPTR